MDTSTHLTGNDNGLECRPKNMPEILEKQSSFLINQSKVAIFSNLGLKPTMPVKMEDVYH